METKEKSDGTQVPAATQVPKQKSWTHTDDGIDFENSFKFWFALMWQNKYIQLFGVALTVTIIELFKFNICIGAVIDNYSDGMLASLMTSMAFLICPTIMGVISYKGFYQFWNDIKTGKSR